MSTLTGNTERLTTTIDAWTNLAPTKSFAGMTLEAFKLAVAPAIAARERVDNLADQLLAARVDRANADKMAMPVIDRMVAAVLADGTEGPDGVLYAGLGYVRKSDRRSGLTRRTGAESETRRRPSQLACRFQSQRGRFYFSRQVQVNGRESGTDSRHR